MKQNAQHANLEAGRRRSSTLGSRKIASATACCAACREASSTAREQSACSSYLPCPLSLLGLKRTKHAGSMHSVLTWRQAGAGPAPWAAGRWHLRQLAALPAGKLRPDTAAAVSPAHATACPLSPACLHNHQFAQLGQGVKTRSSRVIVCSAWLAALPAGKSRLGTAAAASPARATECPLGPACLHVQNVFTLMPGPEYRFAVQSTQENCDLWGSAQPPAGKFHPVTAPAAWSEHTTACPPIPACLHKLRASAQLNDSRRVQSKGSGVCCVCLHGLLRLLQGSFVQVQQQQPGQRMP